MDTAQISITEFIAELGRRHPGIELYVTAKGTRLSVWPPGAYAQLTKAERDFLRTNRLALMREVAAVKEATLMRDAAALKAAAMRDTLTSNRAGVALPSGSSSPSSTEATRLTPSVSSSALGNRVDSDSPHRPSPSSPSPSVGARAVRKLATEWPDFRNTDRADWVPTRSANYTESQGEDD